MLTAYAVPVQQPLDATQADSELLSHLLGCGARPEQIDHDLEILGGEAITQTPGADHALRGDPCTRVVVLTAI